MGFFVLRFVGVFLFSFCYLCGFSWFCVVLVGFFCSWIFFFLFYLGYYYFTTTNKILGFLGGVNLYFLLCFCDLGQGLFFGFQEPADFMHCWC